jgi:hypothetical protein
MSVNIIDYEVFKRKLKDTIGLDLNHYKQQQMQRRINQWLDRVGQLLMAALVVETFNIYVYFPILAASALVTGLFTGVVSDLIITAIRHARLQPTVMTQHGLRKQEHVK